VVYVGIMGMTRPRRLGRPGTSLVGHGLLGLIARTASGSKRFPNDVKILAVCATTEPVVNVQVRNLSIP